MLIRGKSYHDHVNDLIEQLAPEVALQRAVGGDFQAVGRLEHDLLRSLGLRDGMWVVDVGCGSGRLAVQLTRYRELTYIGCDIEPRLLAHARELTGRPDWTFAITDGATVPCGDALADVVCFFSVFTHLPHEVTYRYMCDARRALKPGGRLVFSFLEFQIPSHWEVFANTLAEHEGAMHLNQFVSRDAIHAWARHAGLEVEQLWDGDRPHIPLPEPVEWDNGVRMEGLGCLGQSVAVLRRPD